MLFLSKWMSFELFFNISKDSNFLDICWLVRYHLNCFPKLTLGTLKIRECQIMVWRLTVSSGPKVINLFPCSTQLSTKFILLINVKMPTLTFISMINTTSERLKAINFFICQYFSFYKQLKFRAQLRRA